MDIFGLQINDTEEEESKVGDDVGTEGEDDVNHTTSHIVHLRKYNKTKNDIPMSIYVCDYIKSNEKMEKRKIKSFFRGYLPKQKKSSSNQSDDEEDEISVDLYEESTQEKQAEDDEKVFTPHPSERVSLSWPFWTHESEQIGATNFAPPIFTMKNYYVDMIFRVPTGKSSFNAKTLECVMKMNPDTIITQTVGRVAFTKDLYNVLPLSIEVLREKSNLPGIWDKTLVTKGQTPFVPGVQCALSGEISSLLNNPIVQGDSSGDSVCTPIMYELHSSYTTNPDIIRFLNVDFERLNNQVEQNVGSLDTKYVVLHENDTLQNDLKFLILSYFDEIVACIKDPTARKKKNIIDRKNNVIKIPYIAIFDWLAKKKLLVEKEKKLMDIKDIQLNIKPGSSSDLQYLQAKINSNELNLAEVEYMCLVRMHYIPLRNASYHQMTSSQSPSSSSNSMLNAQIPRSQDTQAQHLSFLYPNISNRR